MEGCVEESELRELRRGGRFGREMKYFSGEGAGVMGSEEVE